MEQAVSSNRLLAGVLAEGEREWLHSAAYVMPVSGESNRAAKGERSREKGGDSERVRGKKQCLCAAIAAVWCHFGLTNCLLIIQQSILISLSLLLCRYSLDQQIFSTLILFNLFCTSDDLGDESQRDWASVLEVYEKEKVNLQYIFDWKLNKLSKSKCLQMFLRNDAQYQVTLWENLSTKHN